MSLLFVILRTNFMSFYFFDLFVSVYVIADFIFIISTFAISKRATTGY